MNDNAIKNKLFLSSLLTTLLMTRAGSDISDLYWYNDGDERYVVIAFTNGYNKKVCVTADSNLAIIQDVCKALY